MSAFTVFNVLPAEKDQFYKGFYLVLLYLDKTPPHLILIIKGKIYSISTKGKQVGEPLEALLKTISLKQIQSLFFQIDLSVLNINEQAAKDSMDQIMQKYTGVNETVTCLYPLKDFFSANLSVDINKASVVFHLIPELYKHNCIKNVYHLFLGDRINDNNIELNTYTIKDIYRRINQLNQ